MNSRDLRPRRRWVTGILILFAIVAYAIGFRVTEFNPGKLFSSLPNSRKILGALLRPDLFTHETTDTSIDIVFPVPCGSAEPGPAAQSGPRLLPQVPCANPGDVITLAGYDMAPNNDVKLQWALPGGGTLFSQLVHTDAQGSFSTQVEVRPINATVDGSPSHLEALTSVAIPGLIPSTTIQDVLNAIMVTIFMALLATTAGTVIAAPVSFLAARNIMGRNWAGKVVYNLVRAILNLTRSYDSLVLAMIFALWVGFGAFAGVLAMTIVTIASLGKLFSEAVENIDPGPLEAISATGANRLQVVLYGVVPQVVPDFISYIIYHWDINVRISTILGFVGGGGIGYYLSQRINVQEYHKAGTAILAITLVVWAMDFLSAEVRKRYT